MSGRSFGETILFDHLLLLNHSRAFGASLPAFRTVTVIRERAIVCTASLPRASTVRTCSPSGCLRVSQCSGSVGFTDATRSPSTKSSTSAGEIPSGESVFGWSITSPARGLSFASPSTLSVNFLRHGWASGSPRAGITDDDIDIIEKACGAKDGVWTVQAEERFPKLVRAHILGGNTMIGGKLKEVLQKIAEWIAQIYETVKRGHTLKVSPGVAKVLDKFLVRQKPKRDVRMLPTPETTDVAAEIVLSSATHSIPGLSKLATQSQSADPIEAGPCSSFVAPYRSGQPEAFAIGGCRALK